MRKYWLHLLSPILMALLLGACGGGETAPITPAADRLTFLFFTVDG